MKIDDEVYSETKVTKLIQFEGKSEITSSYRISNLGQENEASEAFIISFANWSSVRSRLCKEHCYRKEAASVGQNCRLSASCNLFSF